MSAPGGAMRWTTPEGFERCYVIEGKDCTIWIEPRSGDRGNWVATLSVRDPFGQLGRTDGLYIDDADGWPRYYFDLHRASSRSRRGY